MRIFAHRQADNQTKSNSKAEAPFSTVFCGYSGRGPKEVHLCQTKYLWVPDIWIVFLSSSYLLATLVEKKRAMEGLMVVYQKEK